MSDAVSWDGNWAWALPLIVLTLMLHVSVMGFAALLAILLLAFEAALWAAAYQGLGALPDGRSALLYSLNAITAYGHTQLVLAPHWRLMGALEALNGMLLFGLTTAFLYGHIRQVWPAELEPRAAHPVKVRGGA